MSHRLKNYHEWRVLRIAIKLSVSPRYGQELSLILSQGRSKPNKQVLENVQMEGYMERTTWLSRCSPSFPSLSLIYRLCSMTTVNCIIHECATRSTASILSKKSPRRIRGLRQTLAFIMILYVEVLACSDLYIGSIVLSGQIPKHRLNHP